MTAHVLFEDDIVYLSQTAAAKHCRISTSRFRIYAIDQAFKRGNAVYYRLRDIEAHLFPGESGVSSVVELSAERALLTRVNTELAQIELDRARGRVLDADMVEIRWTRMVTNARAKALGLIQRLPPAVRATDFSHRAIAAVVKELVYEFLRELASYDGERPPSEPPNLVQSGEVHRI